MVSLNLENTPLGRDRVDTADKTVGRSAAHAPRRPIDDDIVLAGDPAAAYWHRRR